MSLNQFAGYAGGVLCVVAFLVYIQAIIRGKASSNLVTWFIWALLSVVCFLGYWNANGWVASIWVYLVYAVCTTLIFVALLIFGKGWQWTWVEKWSLVGVMVALVLWVTTGSPIVALTATLAIDIFGAIPLGVTVYKDPKLDYAPGWVMGFAANAVNLLAVEQWDYANAAYPIYLALMAFTFMVLVGCPTFLRKPQVA